MSEIYEHVYEKLLTLQWLLQKNRLIHNDEENPFADTSQGQGRVLAVLKMQPDISTKDLSYILGIRQQSLNELLKKLEKNGYIERIPLEKDKRVSLIRLTEKGKNLTEPENDYSGIFTALSSSELAQFEKYLDKIISTLEKNINLNFNKDMFDWINNARKRMSSVEFEQMLEMRRKVFGDFPFDKERLDMFEWEGDEEKVRSQFFMRGNPPDGMPGAERFSSDYDGPMPKRSMNFFFKKKENNNDK